MDIIDTYQEYISSCLCWLGGVWCGVDEQGVLLFGRWRNINESV